MEWLIAHYQPVGLFSLKHGEATSTGGKSLLIPTPFAVRTALLDVAIRTQGIEMGERAFAHIQSLRLAVRPPMYAAVSGLFTKILKPERHAERERAMQSTIAFREYVHLWDELGLAFGAKAETLEVIAPWLAHVTYFGKRGGFFQLLLPSERKITKGDDPPTGFTSLESPDLPSGQLPETFRLGLIQRLDDWGAELTFEKANIYATEKIRLERDRRRLDVILPYRLVRSGRGFTLYERIA
jgi:hypothetical protein